MAPWLCMLTPTEQKSQMNIFLYINTISMTFDPVSGKFSHQYLTTSAHGPKTLRVSLSDLNLPFKGMFQQYFSLYFPFPHHRRHGLCPQTPQSVIPPLTHTTATSVESFHSPHTPTKTTGTSALP